MDVQVHIADSGAGQFNVVGLADKAAAESRERVRAALAAIGLALPFKRITVNLAPADLPKEGSHYDLPIALGLLAAMGALPGLLPPLDAREALEISLIQSLSGALEGGAISRSRPFCNPHHSASMAALVGGGDEPVPLRLPVRARTWLWPRTKMRAGLPIAHLRSTV